MLVRWKLSGTLEARVVATGVSPLKVISVKVTVPVGVGAEPPTVAVNVIELPTTVLRRSGDEDLMVTLTLGTCPKANSVPPLSV